MSKQINYGWLNDYSGKVFAPITVSSAILINLAKDANGATTTMPLDKFLATQFVTTKNYINNQLNTLENKVDEIRKHVYYLEDDTWAGGQSQGELSNPASGTNNTEEARNKTIQSQVIDVRDRIYTQEPLYYADNEVHYPIENIKDEEMDYCTQEEYSKRVPLQEQIFSNDSEIYSIQFYIRSMIDPEHLTNSGLFLQEIKDGFNAGDYRVKTANTLASDIQVNTHIAELKDQNYKTLIDNSNKILKVVADSSVPGNIIGTIKTTAPDATSVEGTCLKLVPHLPAVDSSGKNITYGCNVITGSRQSDENGYYYDTMYYTFNTNGLLVAQNAGEKLYCGGDKVYATAPTAIPSKSTFPLICGSYNGAITALHHTASGSNSITESTDIYLDYSQSEPVLMGAAWNDYAEYRQQHEVIEPGYCAIPSHNGKLQKTTKRLQYCDGIVSDTFGFSIGKSDAAQTPLAVSGRVLAYPAEPIESYQIGDPVCASIDGKISKMTRAEVQEYPDRIVGTVSEIPEYEKWNNISINGRIWIKVK